MSKLAEKLRTWVIGKSQPIDINLFALENNLTLSKFKSLQKEDKALQEAYNFALDTISGRIKQFWASGKLPGDYAKALLQLYDRQLKGEQGCNCEQKTEYVIVKMRQYAQDDELIPWDAENAAKLEKMRNSEYEF